MVQISPYEKQRTYELRKVSCWEEKTVSDFVDDVMKTMICMYWKMQHVGVGMQ